MTFGEEGFAWFDFSQKIHLLKKNKVRTTKIDEVVALILSKNKEFKHSKNEKEWYKSLLFTLVYQAGRKYHKRDLLFGKALSTFRFRKCVFCCRLCPLF